MAPNFPIVITTAGLQPQSPASLLAQLIALVQQVNPDATFNLPASMVEDISSTDVAAMTLIDQAKVELVNSLTPYGANAFILNQLGQLYGVPLGAASNTSVLLTFSGIPGLVIGKGFVVSDGSHQYVLTDGGIITASGDSSQLFALANVAGSWAVPPNTVTQLVTPPPTGFTLTVTNAEAGVPGSGAQTEESYRTQVLQAGRAAAQGMATFLKTLLGNVDGVQDRLVAAQVRGSDWLIIVGGGDPYEVAYAIEKALGPGIATLVGSELTIAGITAADPGVISTFLNHGYVAGQDFAIADCDPSDYDGDGYAVLAVIDEKTFSMGTPFSTQQLTAASWTGGNVTLTTPAPHGVTVGSQFTIVNCSPAGYNGTWTAAGGTTGSTIVYARSDPGVNTVLGQLQAGVSKFDTTSLPTWVSGGVLTPNPRNIAVTVTDFPDTYVIPYVNPPQQVVTMTVTWGTSSPNFVSSAAVAQMAAPALADYINSIFVGQPINELSMEGVFRAAVSSVLSPEFIIALTFAVSINGIGTAVTMGTRIVEGDPESYFQADPTGISVVQA